MLGAPHRAHRLLVDMTPLESGGQNGGAGLVAASLVQHIAALAPHVDITLLTAEASHAELAMLDAANVQRRCVVARRPTRSQGPSATSQTPGATSLAHSARWLAGSILDRLPPPARVRLKAAYYALRTAPRYQRTSRDLQPDLLFCPFTVPYFWQAGTPCVSIVYDLQDVSYPAFFSAEQRLNRRRHLKDACARADRLVCISAYVRDTLLANVDVAAGRVVAIPLTVLDDAFQPDTRHDATRPDTPMLDRLGLRLGEFLLYPANFWPHKNHQRLFEALRLYRQAHPASKLKLVCTGAPNALMRRLASEAPAGVVFAGYVSSPELAALLDASAALIFPSLYEGFGMPILEAMARGTAVLCSNVTSLPEVAGDAAICFDPTNPAAMAAAMAALDDQPRVASLVARGRQRATAFGTARDLAARYLDVFDDVLLAARR